MKRFVSALLIAAFCICASACGGSGEDVLPYLSEQERAQIEKEIRDSMVFSQRLAIDPYISMSGIASSDIYEFRLVLADSSENLLSLSYLPANSKLFLPVSLAGKEITVEDLAEKELCMFYTIGAYSYTSENFLSEVQSFEADIPEIYLETENGDKHISLDSVTKFNAEEQPPTFKGLRLDSFSPDYYTTVDGGYGVTFEVAYGGLADAELCYKLFDEDGIICNNGQSYVNGSSDQIYLYKPFTAGKYKLVIEQLK